MEYVAGIYLILGIFWAGVGFAVMWYERNDQSHSMPMWCISLLWHLLLWPIAAVAFFHYTAIPMGRSEV